MRSTEEKIILAIVLEDAPMSLTDLSERTHLPKQQVAYWLPRMVDKGTLLRLETPDGPRYQPQPILLCDWIQVTLGELYTECVERSKEFFVFDQAGVDTAEVIRNCISSSLRMFCIQVRDLSK